jgi:hypothetical protein
MSSMSLEVKHFLTYKFPVHSNTNTGVQVEAEHRSLCNASCIYSVIEWRDLKLYIMVEGKNKGKGKVFPMLNWVPPIKTYWGTEGIAPRILDLGTRWRWVASFIPRPLCPQGKIPWYPLGGWVGPRAVLDAVVKRKIASPHRESNPRTPIVQPPCDFWDFPTTRTDHRGRKPPVPLSSWSLRQTVCSTFSRSGWSVVRSTSLAKGGTSKRDRHRTSTKFRLGLTASYISALVFHIWEVPGLWFS